MRRWDCFEELPRGPENPCLRCQAWIRPALPHFHPSERAFPPLESRIGPHSGFVAFPRLCAPMLALAGGSLVSAGRRHCVHAGEGAESLSSTRSSFGSMQPPPTPREAEVLAFLSWTGH